MTTNLSCLEHAVALAGTQSNHRQAALASAQVLFYDKTSRQLSGRQCVVFSPTRRLRGVASIMANVVK